MSNGYMGKILWADLTNRKLREEELDEKTCREYIGGYGLGGRILYTHMKPGADALGPDNIFGIVTGVLTGTSAIGGARYVVVGKSPLTGGWGDANSGGSFGPNLRFAGYDAVFFTGISPEPVYLVIENGKAELRDAAHLWGKDCVEVDDILREEFGKTAESCCIGPAAEKLALIAGVINNKGRAAARSGLGAVMGSKRLKAVVVKGDMKIPMADAAAGSALRKETLPQLGGPAIGLKQFGTPSILMRCATNGDSPIKNWEGVQARDFPTVEELDGNHVIALQEKKYACWRCPVGCGGHMKAGTEYSYPAGAHKPEYESLGMFGTNLLIDNLESIIMANDLCNRSGLDTISAGASIALAMECYEHGIITKEDTGGLELTWGNHEAMVKLVDMMGKREGFGDVLADGAKAAAERIGKGAGQFAMHVQGQEYPAHDPKYGLHWATGYRMDPTPGRHTTAMGAIREGVPVPEMDPKSQQGRGPATRVTQSVACYVQAAGLCGLLAGAYPHIDTFIGFMKAATGWDLTVEEIMKTGERIFNIRQAFNIREGLNCLEYDVPGRMAGIPPKTEGPLAGITLDEPMMDREFCEAFDWDPVTAVPSKQKLLSLGLDDAAAELHP